jgi:uncharacterized protein YaaR (DUF327 family)
LKVTYAPAGAKPMAMRHLAGHKMEASAGQQSFNRNFHDAEREQFEQKIAGLAKRIDEQGAQLADKIDIGEMERYRALISELLNEVISNAYTFRKENSFDSKGRRKVYATVVKINEKLEEMAKDILGGHRDALQIISHIDDIRGLIVDIFL